MLEIKLSTGTSRTKRLHQDKFAFSLFWMSQCVACSPAWWILYHVTASCKGPIKFTCEMSSERAVFLDTEVFKGPRLSTHKILDLQTHFKPTETFQYTHFSSCHPLNCKKAFIKGVALRLLRTHSVRENFEKNKRDFEHRLCKRGYLLTLVQEILTDVKFTDRKEALRNKTTTKKEILPFVTTYNLATPNLKKILMKHWRIIQQQPKLQKIFNQPPIVSYRKEKSLKDILVRAKILQSRKQSQNQRSG